MSSSLSKEQVQEIINELPVQYAFPDVFGKVMLVSMGIAFPIVLREIAEGHTGPNPLFSMGLLFLIVPIMSFLLALCFLKPTSQDCVFTGSGCLIIIAALLTFLPLLGGQEPAEIIASEGGFFLIFGVALFGNCVACACGLAWLSKEVVARPLRALQAHMIQNHITEVELKTWVAWREVMRLLGRQQDPEKVMAKTVEDGVLWHGFRWDFDAFKLIYEPSGARLLAAEGASPMIRAEGLTGPQKTPTLEDENWAPLPKSEFRHFIFNLHDLKYGEIEFPEACPACSSRKIVGHVEYNRENKVSSRHVPSLAACAYHLKSDRTPKTLKAFILMWFAFLGGAGMMQINVYYGAAVMACGLGYALLTIAKKLPVLRAVRFEFFDIFGVMHVDNTAWADEFLLLNADNTYEYIGNMTDILRTRNKSIMVILALPSWILLSSLLAFRETAYASPDALMVGILLWAPPGMDREKV